MNLYGLIGKSLSHSFSANYFNSKFDEEQIDATYKLFELDQIEEVTTLLKLEGLNGLNVTIPYKESVVPFLDSIDPAAQSIGAVNCISFNKGKTCGHNTDAYGFSMALREATVAKPQLKALILGNGGSAKAVKFALSDLGVDFKVVSRSGPLNYKNLHPTQVGEAQLIINTTPLGMFPDIDECPDIPYEAIGSKHDCFDLIYNPEETLFLRKSKLAGASIQNGLNMLKHQAEKSWEFWNAKP